MRNDMSPLDHVTGPTVMRNRRSPWDVRGELRRRSALALAIAGFVLPLAAWILVSLKGWADPVFLPPPWQVLAQLGDWYRDGDLLGDIVVSIVNVELLTLKLRLIVASVETAREIGLDWWTRDPFLSSGARSLELEAENRQLRERLDALEARLESRTGPPAPGGDRS